jgi:hypothetical protein
VYNNKKQKIFFLDLDGTIAGESTWHGFWKNTIDLFKSKIKRPEYKQGYYILTARPKIDKFMIYLLCKLKGLHPLKIITCNTMLYKFTNLTEVCKFKHLVLEKYQLDNPEKQIVYIDKDVSIRMLMKKINHKDGYLIQENYHYEERSKNSTSPK